MVVDPCNIGIQIKREELTKTFMMIYNWKKPFGLHGLFKNISALKGSNDSWRAC